MQRLDDIDIKILRELQQNAKLTVKELADKVHLSASPTFERQKRLERVGNSIIALCNIKLKQHSSSLSRAFMEAVRGIEEVSECYNTSGDYDFMMKIYVRDMEHYQEFVLNKLGKIDSIGSLHSIFVIGEVKNTHKVPIVTEEDL